MLVSSDSRLSFEKSKSGRKGFSLPARKVQPEGADTWGHLKRKSPLVFPEMTEPEVVRHFVNLSKKNFSIDTQFYPLGSCTMKYNPKINELAAAIPQFQALHPFQPESTLQGMLSVFHNLEKMLIEIAGMDRFTLQPAAGAHGELTGIMIVKAYHDSRGDTKRTQVLVPDSSHGTNPASAALFGYRVIELKTNARGRVDLEVLKKNLSEETACLMLTNPNTLGLFEEDILKIKELVHAAGGLLYYDGANLNPLLGIARPGDMGFDIVHINLHKTFSTPHGGGGPGSGPVGVKKHLVPFLPRPLIDLKPDGSYFLNHEGSKSIGRVKAFYGNTGMILRALVYIMSLGMDGLLECSEGAILNANYLRAKLKKLFSVAIDESCMHEFVLTLKDAKAADIHAGDIGKRLLEMGFHAPTVHFPIVVEEALMIEPTETETIETLDTFIQAMKIIAKEIKEDPERIKNAPQNLPITRPDEVLAARKPILTYRELVREKVLQAENPASV